MTTIYQRLRTKKPWKKNFRTKTAVKKLARKVQNLTSQEELKQAWVSISPAAGLASAQNGNFRLLTNIPQGTTKIQRVGNKVSMIGIRIRGSMVNGSITGPALMRMVIFIVKQPTGVNPTNAQLMADTTAATNWNSPFNIDYRKTFRILKDKTWAFNNGGGATDQAEVKNFRFARRFKKPVEVQFNSATSAIADFVKNPVFIVLYTDSAAGVPFMALTAEILYRDS